IGVTVNELVFVRLYEVLSRASYFPTSRILVRSRKLTLEKISYGNYTVDRSFQVRENVLQMKYIVQCIVPAALISSPCFIFFATFRYGPKSWLLSRSIAYAAWDLFFSLFRVVYLFLEIRMHPQIWREFKNLGVIHWLFK
ncbi:hypothetical protein PENTCL1PPCAC_27294, partial [Pristionchus entomophagus]